MNLTADKFSDFFQFNAQSYPSRSNIEKRFTFQVLDNPLVQNRSSQNSPHILITYNDKGQIVGQFGLNPAQYHLENKTSLCFCGFDLFVSPEYRGKGLGSSLVKTALEKYSPFFPIDVSESARKLYSQCYPLGSVYSFLWIRNFRNLFKSGFSFITQKYFNRGSPDVGTTPTNFPSSITLKNDHFKLVTSLPHWEYTFWKKEVLEFSRTAEFLKWRFFQQPGYGFYLLSEKDQFAYFVVRKVNLKGLHLLAIVDYRISSEDKNLIVSILQGSKWVAKQTNSDGIIIMCSHSLFEKQLRKNLFTKVGKAHEILVDVDLGFSTDTIKKRTALLLTMADGDFEFAYW